MTQDVNDVNPLPHPRQAVLNLLSAMYGNKVR